MFVYIKKHLLGLCFIVFLLVTMWPLNSFAGEPITVFFNNVQIELDIPPVLDHSRVLIPLKVVSGTLGAQMNWDPETKTITALTRTKFLRLSLDEKKAFVNGNKLDWDAPVKIIKGRTMVPIRFVAENLGLWVEWQAEFKRVVIKDKQSNLGQNLSQREEFLPGEWPISYKRIQNENSPQGFHQDLYRTTLFGNENRLVVEDIPRDYSWSPSGTRVAMDQDVLVYGAGTANPYASWVKDMESGRETLVSYPSGIMGPNVPATWLGKNKILTSQGTTAPEARAIVVDTQTEEMILEFPAGFEPLGPWKNGYLGIQRERGNWAVAKLAKWEHGKGLRTLYAEMASNFSLDPTGERVAWLDDSTSKLCEDNSYGVDQVIIYHLGSGYIDTYPLWGHEAIWSPDGKYLAVPMGSKLQVLEIASGEISQLENFNTYPRGHFTWRPDSGLLVWEKKVSKENGSRGIELWYWQVTDGEIAPLFISESLFTEEPVWSPDGASLLYVAGEGDSNRLFLWDINSNLHRPLTPKETGVNVTDPRWVPGC
jgi:Tol biopolymer transport system component